MEVLFCIILILLGVYIFIPGLFQGNMYVKKTKTKKEEGAGGGGVGGGGGRIVYL